MKSELEYTGRMGETSNVRNPMKILMSIVSESGVVASFRGSRVKLGKENPVDSVRTYIDKVSLSNLNSNPLF